MRSRNLLLFALIALCAIFATASPLVAEDKPAEPQGGMPPTGPPAEMKELEFLVGTWDVIMGFKMEPTDTVMAQSKGVCTFKWLLGGGALQSEYASEFMGVPFQGIGLDCYDRETKKWQSVWSDNMACRMTLYVGDHKDGKWIYTGEDTYMGMKLATRITSYNMTPTSYDWMVEQSYDGGKTFHVMGKATYTKRQ